MSGDETLDTLFAEREIRNLIARYCFYVRHRDLAGIAALMAQDVRVTIADNPEVCGRDELMKWMSHAFDHYEYIHQRCDTGLIEVTGETAKSRFAVFETTFRSGEQKASLIYGDYEDSYIRLPEGWRFSTRRFHLHRRMRVDLDALQVNEITRPITEITP